MRPGPPGSAQESVASNQRARLYGAMIEMVANRGYEASTVVESCVLAGVSKRTLYERFLGGKQECFLATYDIIVRRAEMRILAAGWCGLDPLADAGPAGTAARRG
jgi:AcrR family transcriptional regulator